MRFLSSRLRTAALGLGVATTILGAGIFAHNDAAIDAQQQGPARPRVLMYDNDGTFQPGDAATGYWTFAPNHITVKKGESIEFVNPAGNKRPHTVTSISHTQGTSFPNLTFDWGTNFNSSTSRDNLIMPGGTYDLDTSEMNPGHYLYYCALHIWMVGTFTVTN